MASRARKQRGQIVPRGEDKHLVRIYIGRDDDGRKQYHNRTIAGPLKEAQKYLTAKLGELDTGLLAAGNREEKRQTLKKHLQEWLSTKKARARTLSDYRWLVRSYVDPHMNARIRLQNLTPKAIRRIYLDLQARGLSPRTVRYVHSVLRQALEQAVTDGLIPRNPAVLARNVLEKVERSEKQVLSIAAAKTFMAAVQSDRFAALWLLLLDTGMRPGEALALRWPDLDLEAGIVRIQRALVEPRLKGETWRLERPKTDSSVRSVPLMQSTVAALKAHRARQLEARLKLGEHWAIECPPDLVFSSEAGTFLRKSNLHRRNWKPILAAAKLPHMRPYDLRHSAATLMLALGESVKTVQMKLGHADATLTLNTYAHMLDGLQQQATKRMEQALAGEG